LRFTVKSPLNPAANVFSVASCEVSERIMFKHLPWGSEILPGSENLQLKDSSYSIYGLLDGIGAYGARTQKKGEVVDLPPGNMKSINT
jgi:hypothetical protein